MAIVVVEKVYMSGLMEKTGLEAEAEIFLQPHAEVGFAATLAGGVTRARLAFVVGTAADGGGREQAELAVAGLAVVE
jgi:hypothetical protein